MELLAAQETTAHLKKAMGYEDSPEGGDRAAKLDRFLQKITLVPAEEDERMLMAQQQLSTMWFHTEIRFDQDRTDMKHITAAEDKLIGFLMAFFAIADDLVEHNLSERLAHAFSDQPHVICFLHLQAAIEVVHSQTYKRMLACLIHESNKVREWTERVWHSPAVRRKMEWITRHMIETEELALNLAAFAAVEGVFFAASFAIIESFRQRNKFPGIATANEFILRDENLHCTHGCYLFCKEVEKLPPAERGRVRKQAAAIVKESADIERLFVKEALSDNAIPSLPEEQVSNYVCWIADVVLSMMRLPRQYEHLSECPLEFMKNMQLGRKNNFFERVVTQYNHSLMPFNPEHLLDFNFKKVVNMSEQLKAPENDDTSTL